MRVRSLAPRDRDGGGDRWPALPYNDSPVRLFRTEPPAGHWLLVDAFDPRLNRRALGARITVAADDRRQVRTVQGAMSYLSSSDPRAHFGLGSSESPVTVSVRWPDGLEETFDSVAVDQTIVLRRGEGQS